MQVLTIPYECAPWLHADQMELEWKSKDLAGISQYRSVLTS